MRSLLTRLRQSCGPRLVSLWWRSPDARDVLAALRRAADGDEALSRVAIHLRVTVLRAAHDELPAVQRVRVGARLATTAERCKPNGYTQVGLALL